MPSKVFEHLHGKGLEITLPTVTQVLRKWRVNRPGSVGGSGYWISTTGLVGPFRSVERGFEL